mmetsp:Transcript_14031/g.49873  ORF Transcript_14031/g.49873 Transcript_14031/m.49873 type:complete len:411 (+) Transcript_14031:1198-2430(+)
MQRRAMRFVLEQTKPWQALMEKSALKGWGGVVSEYVVIHTVAVWHRYAQAGRIGEIVGSRKANLLVTSRGNILLANGGASGGVSTYSPEATPSILRALVGSKSGSVMKIVLPDAAYRPCSKKNVPGRLENPIVITDANKAPEEVPRCIFDVKYRRGLRSTSMSLTDLAGTYKRWDVVKRLYDAKAWHTMTPIRAMRLNLDESVANQPLLKCGFLFKKPYHRTVIAAQKVAARQPPPPPGPDVDDGLPVVRPSGAVGPSGVARPSSMTRQPSRRGSVAGAVHRASLRIEGASTAAGIRSEEKERFFILQGGILRYFKREADDMPKGQLCLATVGGVSSKAYLKSDGDDAHAFAICTPAAPDGILVRASSADDEKAWATLIDRTINVDLDRQFRAIQRKHSTLHRDFAADQP